MSENTLNPNEMRQKFLLRLNEVAHEWATKEGDLSPEERCHGTVFGVLSVIDGVDGNGSDGKGLPLFQIVASPSPEYNKARVANSEPIWDNRYPLDYVNGDIIATHRHEFAHIYDTTKSDLARSAASLFT